MTDLNQLADIALKMARSTLWQTQAAGLVVVFGYPDGRTDQLPPEISNFLGQCLNSGKLKDLLFGAIRRHAQNTGADAVVMATEAWRGKSTDAARALPFEEFQRLSAESGFETLVQLGMVERCEAIVATAQNAERVVITSQEFRREGNGRVYSFGEVETQEFPQSQFDGRQKMFGGEVAETPFDAAK